jgi:hypothetical protein
MGVSPGDTFRGDPSALGTAGGAHLWIIVDVYTPELDTCVLAVMVNATSNIPGAGDTSCVLEKGDHPFIHHRSYVFYLKTYEISVTELQALKLPADEPVSPSLLTRIRQGLHKSTFTKQRFKDNVPKI